MLTRIMVGTMGLPCRGSADSREEGGTKGTSETMGIRGTNGVIIRAPTVVAGGPLRAVDRGTNGVIIREPTVVAGVPSGRGTRCMGVNTGRAEQSVWQGVRHGGECI